MQDLINWLTSNPTAVIGVFGIFYARKQIKNNLNISKYKNTLDAMLKLSTEKRLVDGKLALNAYIECKEKSLDDVCSQLKHDPCIVIDYLNYIEILCIGSSYNYETVDENLLINNIGDIIIRCNEGIIFLQENTSNDIKQDAYPSIKLIAKKSKNRGMCSACCGYGKMSLDEFNLKIPG